MNPAKLLLIEDSSADATLFTDQIQNQLGSDIEIEWKTRLSDALAWLEAGNKPDQIWLDPGLPDLGQGISKALTTLKKYVPAGELRLLSSTVSPSLARAAEQQQVEVLHKDATTTQVLQIVQELLSKRSGGTTARIETAKLEGKIAKLEYQLDISHTRLARIEATLERLSTVSFEVGTVKEALNRIPQLEKALSELQKTSESTQQIRLKRWDVMQAIIVALISAAVAIGTILLAKSPSPTPTPSTNPSQRP